MRTFAIFILNKVIVGSRRAILPVQQDPELTDADKFTTSVWLAVQINYIYFFFTHTALRLAEVSSGPISGMKGWMAAERPVEQKGFTVPLPNRL